MILSLTLWVRGITTGHVVKMLCYNINAVLMLCVGAREVYGKYYAFAFSLSSLKIAS